MQEPQLVVMAAGIGSRYGGLKQIDPVGPSGEIVLDYAVYDALKAGFKKVVFIVRKDIEQAFRQSVGKAVEKRVETAYVCQELDKLPPGLAPPAGRTKPWGTGHAVLCAKDAITAPFAAINADDFYGAHSFKILCDYLAKAKDRPGNYDCCMVGFVLDNTLTEHGHVARGVCTTTPDGLLSSIVERTKIRRFGRVVRYAEGDDNWVDIPADSVVSMNMWGFTPGILAELECRFASFFERNVDNPKAEYFLPSVVNELIQESKAEVKILRTDSRWIGVTYKEDKPKVKQAIREMVDQGVYPERLWEQAL